MYRKLSLTICLSFISLLLASCGGGGRGADVDVPSGQNPGIPSAVQLGGSQNVAQTGTSITLMATVLDGTGRAVQGVNVTFTNLSSIGTLNGASTTTGSDGIARATLSSTTSGFITVRASTSSGNGQIWDDETFYFSSGEPTLPGSSIFVIAVPSTIAPGESSTVTAFVLTGKGAEVPDGTIINFSTDFGSITSFATTSDGRAEATYTAPSTSGAATITASYSGVSNTTTVTVTWSLTVFPSPQTLTIIDPSQSYSATYTISGGQPSYSVYSSHPILVSVSVSGSTVTANVENLPTEDTTVTITIVDSVRNSTEATLVLDIP